MEPFDSDAEYVNGAKARLITGIAGQGALLRLVVLGEIRVQALPGRPVRYHRGDCERIGSNRRALELAGA